MALSKVTSNSLSSGITTTFGAGAVGTPSITTTGDTNTGIYFPAADTIAFSEGGAEAARFNSSGNLQIYNLGLGGTTPSTSGTGITFPASQSASSDANTLDDYEEGTWSPSLGGNTTYSGQDARYTKVGKLVNCFFDITINLIGTGSASAMSGFPFTNSATIATGSVSFYSGIATTTNFISFYIGGSGTSCSFVGNNGNATTIGLNGFAVFGNSARVVGSITYQTS